ncbi:MAG TPA: DUF4177 domain-containing protein [Thermoanaerobaculia bacterium]|jgi:hypothetical protein
MQPEQWEYEFFSTMDLPEQGWFKRPNRDDVRDYLNKLGQDGWEVINVVFAVAYGPDYHMRAILKRRKQQ